MQYQKALEVLENALTFGIDPSLEPIERMCAQMGNPQDSYICIQVAGTNGKSSVTRMIAALLRAQGKRVALYTSPELVRYPERMEIDGNVISDQQFADAIEAARDAAEACGLEVTEFELLTAGALWLYAREGVEVAVLECGLGGRWDATSVCRPAVSVITGIDLDHTAILGDTVEQIAAEKAAIIKPGSTAVLAENVVAREVFLERAEEVGAPVVEVNPFLKEELMTAVAHMPAYQSMNASTAVTAVQALLGKALATDEIERALTTLQIPGRFETLRSKPLLLIDAAHNPQSAQVLANEIRLRWPDPATRPTLLLGVLADKDVHGICEALVPLFNRIVCTASSSPRAISAGKLAAEVAQVVAASNALPGGLELSNVPTIPEALKELAGKDVIATGSITVAGEVKGCFLNLGR